MTAFLSLRGQSYTAHPFPAGAHAGGLNPPEPLGIPFNLTLAADISFSIAVWLHTGQVGRFLSEGKTSSSN